MTPPEGDGSVFYTINPKSDLPTGTEIRNTARIIFDTNEPIDTPEWLNTIDNSKPESNVLPLDSQQATSTFDVSWTGSDEGAGIQDPQSWLTTMIKSATQTALDKSQDDSVRTDALSRLKITPTSLSNTR